MTRAAEIRARLNHPIIDCDGHILEFQPAFLDYLKKVAGPNIVRRFVRAMREGIGPYHFEADQAERRRIGAPRGPWWGSPAKLTTDRATAMLPNMLRARLDSFGIDFSLCYPTFGLFLVREDDDELRRALCRAINTMHAELFSANRDRLMPVAMIPIYSPGEAIEELRYSVRELGYKAITISGFVRRRIPAKWRHGAEASGYNYFYDNIALDSEHDYDPFWQTCLDLQVVPNVHSSSIGEGSRTSPSTYIYNHIGMFAATCEAFAKALILGGVPNRFPGLKFAFMEAGVAWAVELLNGMASHWEKRNGIAIEQFNPQNISIDELYDCFAQYGHPVLMQEPKRLRESLERIKQTDLGRVEVRDEFGKVGASSVADLADIFAKNFFFGCEADDRTLGTAYDPRFVAAGRRLQPIFGSDIGHWDVPDMTKVLEEAYEQVETGRMSEDDFCDFTFRAPMRLYTGTNRTFFSGTILESLADEKRTASHEKV
jgi:predicted TIM-barrel fold metal-dependent hydrolase